MAKVKSLMMDLQEAQQRVEKLRKVEYNWLDQFQVAEEVENFWYA